MEIRSCFCHEYIILLFHCRSVYWKSQQDHSRFLLSPPTSSSGFGNARSWKHACVTLLKWQADWRWARKWDKEAETFIIVLWRHRIQKLKRGTCFIVFSAVFSSLLEQFLVHYTVIDFLKMHLLGIWIFRFLLVSPSVLGRSINKLADMRHQRLPRHRLLSQTFPVYANNLQIWTSPLNQMVRSQ